MFRGEKHVIQSFIDCVVMRINTERCLFFNSWLLKNSTFWFFPPFCCLTWWRWMMNCFHNFSTSCSKNPEMGLKGKSVSAFLAPDLHWIMAEWLYLNNGDLICAFYWNMYMFKHCVKCRCVSYSYIYFETSQSLRYFYGQAHMHAMWPPLAYVLHLMKLAFLLTPGQPLEIRQ